MLYPPRVVGIALEQVLDGGALVDAFALVGSLAVRPYTASFVRLIGPFTPAHRW